MKEINKLSAIYGVYDTKDNDLLVFLGDINDIVKYFNSTKRSIRTVISRKKLKQKRYSIVSMKMYQLDIGDEEVYDCK